MEVRIIRIKKEIFILMNQDPLILSEDFKVALDLLEDTSSNLFITGRAGTGKSTLLQLFRKTTRKKVVVLAPTGVAALNVGGQTIHSFFGFAPRLLTSADIKKKKRTKMYEKIEVLIIDEISMVRADQLDNIDYALRLNRSDPRPFGGVQMVFIGDLFQLPPVVATPYEKQYFQTVYETPYFFSAKVLEQNFTLHTVELHKIYRQDERRFINLLEDIRSGMADEDTLEALNTRVQSMDLSRDHYITLTARNHVANSINTRELNKIDKTRYVFQAKIDGNFNVKLFPTDQLLVLKEGAQVMFIKNDPLKKYVNGTIGVITRLDEKNIFVKVQDQKEPVEVHREEWEMLKYSSSSKEGEIKTETIGTFNQYPLRLAWAITVHKSQGKTFEKVIIDLGGGGAFEHGQTYVALSRCKTLEGIVLKHPIKYRDVLIDERIIDFYQQISR